MSKPMRFLLLSYYAPPLNAITSQRAFSLGQFLSQLGNKVDLVTRHWTGNEKSWQDCLTSSHASQIVTKSLNSNFTIHYLPYTSTLPRLNKLTIIKEWLKGNTNPVIDPFQFYLYLKELCEKNSYDYLYTTCPPENCVQVVFQLYQTYHIPYIIDFRDYFNSVVLKKGIHIDIIAMFKEWQYRIQNKHILQNATLITTASEYFTNFLREKVNIQNTITVLNGFEEDFFDDLIKTTKKSDHFTISCIGTLYPTQNLTPLLHGLKIFIENNKYSQQNIRINFIGAKSIPIIENQIKKWLPFENIFITPFIERTKALQIGAASHILIYAGWKNYKGVYSGKIFEYLGLRKNILIAPRDNDVIDRLLAQTKAGGSFDHPHEVANFLQTKYEEWKKTGDVKYYGIPEEIQKFTRSYQNKKILEFLKTWAYS